MSEWSRDPPTSKGTLPEDVPEGFFIGCLSYVGLR